MNTDGLMDEDWLFAHVCVRASCLRCKGGGWIQRTGRLMHDSLREDCTPRPDWTPICREFFDGNGRACPRPAGAKSSGA